MKSETSYEEIDKKCKEALQTIKEYIWKTNPELTGFSVQDSGAIEVLKTLSRFSKRITNLAYGGCHYHEVFHTWQDHPTEIETQMTYDYEGNTHIEIEVNFTINFKDAHF